MVNDLRVCARDARARIGGLLSATWGLRYRYLLGVKWSQVQILSARHCQPDCVLSARLSESGSDLR